MFSKYYKKKKKALHYSCWTKMSILQSAKQFLCSLASVHKVWLQVGSGEKIQWLVKHALFIIGTG